MTDTNPPPPAAEAPVWTPKPPSMPVPTAPKRAARRAPSKLPKTLDPEIAREFADSASDMSTPTAAESPPPDLLLEWDGLPVPSRRPPADSSGPDGSSLTGPLGEARKTPPGRPTKYNPLYCDLVKDFMGRTGRSLVAFAGFINVNPDTVYQWKRTIPEFGEAASIANAMRTNVLEQGLFAARTNPELMSRMFALKNAAPGEFKDKVEIERTGENGTDPKFAQTVIESAVRAAIEAGLPKMIVQLQDSLPMRRKLEEVAGANMLTTHGQDELPVIEGEIVEGEK